MIISVISEHIFPILSTASWKIISQGHTIPGILTDSWLIRLGGFMAAHNAPEDELQAVF